MANTAQPVYTIAMTPDQIAMLPQAQQAAYMKNASPAQQAAVQAAIQQQIVSANRKFMRQALERYAYCPVSGGSGTTATYAPGQTLTFDFPVVGSGYAKGLLITYNIQLTPATGSSATYQTNAAAPWNIFQEIDVNYNGSQIRTHPYVLKLLDMTKGFGRGIQNAVIAGNNDSTIAANIVGSTPLVVNTSNTWTGKIYLPLNALGEDTVPGLLPSMGVGNKPQLKLQCANSFLGADPLLNPVSSPSGTGAAITVANTSTINVDMVYMDGSNMGSTNGLGLNLANEPTLQYYWDTPLNPLTTGTINRQHISTLLEHWYVFSLVIDGRQSTSFSTVSNLQQLVLSPDSVGQQTFKNFNVANNISVYDYYDRRRRQYGQDMDEGVVIWVDAATSGVVDSDNRNGAQVLNMRGGAAGGYPAATHGYYVGAVSSSTIAPRVETFLISMNYAGLKIQ